MTDGGTPAPGNNVGAPVAPGNNVPAPPSLLSFVGAEITRGYQLELEEERFQARRDKVIKPQGNYMTKLSHSYLDQT
jgi:hypothetical protein